MRTMMRVSLMIAAVAALPFAATPSKAQPGWVELGCQRVNFGIDRDVVRVGRRDGTFRAIRLRARGNTVHMLDVKVVYGNGVADDIPVRANIPGWRNERTERPPGRRSRDRSRRADLSLAAEFPRRRRHLRRWSNDGGGRAACACRVGRARLSARQLRA